MPTVSATANVWVRPQAGAMSLAGYAPVLEGEKNAYPAAGQIVITGLAPLLGRTTAIYGRADANAVYGDRPAQVSSGTRAAQKSPAARSAQKSTDLRIN